MAEASCYGIRDPEGGDHIPRAVIVLKSQAQATTTTEIRDFVDCEYLIYQFFSVFYI